jgi:phage terminase large subunit-like protein
MGVSDFGDVFDLLVDAGVQVSELEGLGSAELDALLGFVLADGEVVKLLRDLGRPIYSFQPRPDDPANLDEQSKFVNDDFKGVKICLAGNAAGKTEAAAFMVCRFLLNNPAPRDLVPFVIASQSYDMCGAIYVEKIKKYLEGSIESVRWRNVNRQFPAEVILKPNNVNGNRYVLQFASYEQGRQAFQAISAVGWWCDEQTPGLEIITELFCRVRDFPAEQTLQIHTLTPLEPSSYDLEELYKNRFEDSVKNSFRFYRLNTMKNDKLSESWKKAFFDVVPEDMQATRQLGAFARFEGLIYKEFREEVHVIPQKKIPIDGVHFRAIDFGYRNMACVWGALVKGAWLIYDCVLLHDELCEDFASVIAERSKEYGWQPHDVRFGATYADWEDPAGMVRMRDAGVYCLPARKEVGAGINCVRSKFLGLGGVPQLYIMDNCKELIREIREYAWARGPKNPINRADDPDKPVKFHDHCVDALRYLIYSRELSTVEAWDNAKPVKNQRAMFGSTKRS